MRQTIVFAGLGILLSQYSSAGLIDSPPATLSGVPSQVVYRMGPVYFRSGHSDTVVTCTNHDRTRASVALELFDAEDNPAGALASAEVPSGGSVTFATSTVPRGDNLVVVQDVPPLEHGKARVSATTTKLSCAAYHRFRSEDGSIQEHALAFVKNVSRTVSR
ncbi:MAG: hypothetical protein ACT4O5_08950 [Gammaproteobacteria bacterium]